MNESLTSDGIQHAAESGGATPVADMTEQIERLLEENYELRAIVDAQEKSLNDQKEIIATQSSLIEELNTQLQNALAESANVHDLINATNTVPAAAPEVHTPSHSAPCSSGGSRTPRSGIGTSGELRNAGSQMAVNSSRSAGSTGSNGQGPPRRRVGAPGYGGTSSSSSGQPLSAPLQSRAAPRTHGTNASEQHGGPPSDRRSIGRSSNGELLPASQQPQAPGSARGLGLNAAGARRVASQPSDHNSERRRSGSCGHGRVTPTLTSVRRESAGKGKGGGSASMRGGIVAHGDPLPGLPPALPGSRHVE